MMPRTDGLPRPRHSIAAQIRAPAQAARCVTRIAMQARGPALSAEPPLNPNQPTQSRPVPTTAIVIPTCTEEHALAQSDVPITGRGPEWVSLRAGWYKAFPDLCSNDCVTRAYELQRY